ncbi:glycosyltransferase family 4 protein [Coleofasciculus sp. G2-EDA-02]|uniref:glycosyltransferase family 4 protein n=1 Tax=Coleofasciculus sp. G2-EDA-02 TaxID=3069529 RepID=UPI0032FC2E64
MNIQPKPAIALLHWGDLIEDFLDSIGISFEGFCQEMTGGWMFGYIDALRLAGVRTVLFCISAQVNTPTRYTHFPTGATICVLPAPKSYRAIHRPMVRGVSYLLSAVLRDIAPYLATPLRILAHELRQEGCQAILCQEYEYARFDMCVLLGQLIGLPVFATFQGGDFQMSRLERPLRPFSMQACAGLIVATQTEVQRVQSRYGVPSSKIAQIFNPLDLSIWDESDRVTTRATLGIPPEAEVVVWHGRIDLRRKGLDILTTAWEQVCHHRRERDLRLLLVGTGSDADQLRQRISQMHLPGVIWINEYILDRTAIRNYLAAADLYTLPSRHEGFPVAPLEAMACGLPVVATDAPGVPDILENGELSGGLIVPREDATALALALGRVLDDPAWRCELGKHARHRVETSFSLEAVGKQLRDFLFSDSSNLS